MILHTQPYALPDSLVVISPLHAAIATYAAFLRAKSEETVKGSCQARRSVWIRASVAFRPVGADLELAVESDPEVVGFASAFCTFGDNTSYLLF